MDDDVQEAMAEVAGEIKAGAGITQSEAVQEQASKPMPRCPFCSGHYEKSYNVCVVGLANFVISCTCGLMSKPFNTRHELLYWWHTRGGKTPKDMPAKIEISLKHSPAVNKGNIESPQEALASQQNSPF